MTDGLTNLSERQTTIFTIFLTCDSPRSCKTCHRPPSPRPCQLCLTPVSRVGTICRQYYWEQYIGPLLAKIPIILLLLVLVVIHNFKFHIFVIVLLLLVFKIRNIGLFLVHIWYCVGIVHLQALITKVKIIS